MNAKQARLSVVMGVVAALGTAVIGWAWWASTQYVLLWANKEWWIASALSKIQIRFENTLVFQLGYDLGFNMDRFAPPTGLADLFPGIELSPGVVVLPIWFILGAFLSVLLLLWLFLMKRLARPRITEGEKVGGD